MLIKPRYTRKDTTRTFEEAVQMWMKANHLEDKMMESAIVTAWAELTGPTISRHTKKVSIENRVLKIVVDNAPLRHQLAMSKTQLIQIVNKKAGRQVVVECLVL